MKLTISFNKGYADAISLEDSLQFIEIDLTTLERTESSEVLFEDDVPDLGYLKSDYYTVDDLINTFKHKGWRLY